MHNQCLRNILCNAKSPSGHLLIKRIKCCGGVEWGQVIYLICLFLCKILIKLGKKHFSLFSWLSLKLTWNTSISVDVTKWGIGSYFTIIVLSELWNGCLKCLWNSRRHMFFQRLIQWTKRSFDFETHGVEHSPHLAEARQRTLGFRDCQATYTAAMRRGRGWRPVTIQPSAATSISADVLSTNCWGVSDNTSSTCSGRSLNLQKSKLRYFLKVVESSWVVTEDLCQTVCITNESHTGSEKHMSESITPERGGRIIHTHSRSFPTGLWCFGSRS